MPSSYIETLSTPNPSGSSTPALSKKKGPAVAPRRGGKKAPAPAPTSAPAEPAGQYVEALYTYAAANDGEAGMDEGERLLVVAPDAGDGWIEIERSSGERGVVPSGWVREA